MARKDALAALAGLAALNMLMDRKTTKRPDAVATLDTATTVPDEYARFKPTETQYGAFGEEPTSTFRTLEDAPQSVKGSAPVRRSSKTSKTSGTGKVVGFKPGMMTPEEMAARYVPRRQFGRQNTPETPAEELGDIPTFKKGGKVKSKSASSRADGCCKRGKTRGKMY